MIRAASSRAKGRDKKRLAHFMEVLEGDDEIEDKLHDVKSDELLDLMWRNSDRAHAARLECEHPIEVELRGTDRIVEPERRRAAVDRGRVELDDSGRILGRAVDHAGHRVIEQVGPDAGKVCGHLDPD